MDDAESEKYIKKFFDLYFSSYREKFIENWGDDVTKMNKNDHNSKNKYRQNLKFDCSLVQPIGDLSCKFNHFFFMILTYASKTLKPGLAKGSTNPKKNPDPGCYLVGDEADYKDYNLYAYELYNHKEYRLDTNKA